jgi:hypothetical protein
MLEFLRYRRCPEGNPPHEACCCLNLFPFFSCSFITTISYSLGFSFPIRHFYVYQAQPTASTASWAATQN